MYDPHIAPVFREWRDNYEAQRQRRRRTVPVPSARRRQDSNASDERLNTREEPTESPVELDTMVSQTGWDDVRSSSNIRQRNVPNALDEVCDVSSDCP